MARLKKPNDTNKIIKYRKQSENRSENQAQTNTGQSRIQTASNRCKQGITTQINEIALQDQCATNKNVNSKSILDHSKSHEFKLRKCVVRLKRLAIPNKIEKTTEQRETEKLNLMMTPHRTVVRQSVLQRIRNENKDEEEPYSSVTQTIPDKEQTKRIRRRPAFYSPLVDAQIAQNKAKKTRVLSKTAQTPSVRPCAIKLMRTPSQRTGNQAKKIPEENQTHVQDLATPSVRRCAIKLMRTPSQRSGNQAKKIPEENQTHVQDLPTPSVRRCAIKLMRTPSQRTDNQAKKISEKNQSHVQDLPTPSVRRCAIKLMRTPSQRSGIQTKKASREKRTDVQDLPSPSVRRCSVKIMRTPSQRPSKQTRIASKRSLVKKDSASAKGSNREDVKKRDGDSSIFKRPKRFQESSGKQISKTKEDLVKKSGIISSTPIAESKTQPNVNDGDPKVPRNTNKFMHSLMDLEEFESVLSKNERSSTKKLSLSTKAVDSLKTMDHTADYEFSHFEPARNSTVFPNSLKDKTIAGKKQKEIRLSTVSSKSNENSNIFHEEDEKIDDTATNKPTTATLTTNKTCKFFHRNPDRNNTEKKVLSPAKRPRIRQTLRGNERKVENTNAIETGNVYEFLSQSQSSGSDSRKKSDPAADIIKKLIKEGKVSVATKAKGKGKPVIKAKKRQMRKVAKQRKEVKLKEKAKKPPDLVLGTADNGNHFDDGPLSPLPDLDELCENIVSPPETMKNTTHLQDNEPPETISITPPSTPAREEMEVGQFGGNKFSNLARTVLIQETGKEETKQKDLAERRRLLNFARNFLNKPETKTSTKQPSCNMLHTPCRISEDAYLPKEFSFRVNDSSLPSFSSDFYPASPRKNKMQKANQTKEIEKDSTNKNVAEDDNDLGVTPIENNKEDEPMDFTDGREVVIEASEAHQVSDMPSFADSRFDMNLHHTNESKKSNASTSNDSNMENVPPPNTGVEIQNETDANADIFNLRQLPNPRRALPNRSPLKNINILEVVIIPAPSAQNKATDLETKNQNNLPESHNLELEDKDDEDNLEATANLDKVQDQKLCEDNESENTNLFGFEEFLENDELAKETDSSAVIDKKQRRTHIKKKLRELRKLRPADHDLTIDKSTHALTPTVFDEYNRVTRQRTVKEMLCSTMIKPQKHINIKLVNDDSADDENADTEKKKGESKTPDLFEDLEPQVSFNQKNPPRTYSRQPLRKRKSRHNFIMFSSDDSSDEEEEKKKKEKKQQKKRGKKNANAKEKHDLDSFVDEFNEMCKDVENYDMIIE